MNKAMDHLRNSIIADVSEDTETIGELTSWHADLVDAWNSVPGVDPITDNDLDA